MGFICAVISWFLTKESRLIRLLAALLIGATWPFSFPTALLVSLFLMQKALAFVNKYCIKTQYLLTGAYL
ncbi:Protein of uncharacterised function (DUF2566) [Raoultella terrigena]|uniref:Protein of uncharacterized function (DUF2566) n=1 Tax=Raoultella terrigena TaxID=577 RepID=A0A4U9D002_RAOTE|nr:Protein of uncharacterised function (DUF2566) [Raoultella terrigena]